MNYQREIKTVIDLISISVCTAPKSGGVDDIVFFAASNQQKNKIAQEMINIGIDKAKGKTDKTIAQAIKTSWFSDAKTVKDSQALILIAVYGKRPFGANCGGCGFRNCAEFKAHIYSKKYTPVMGPFCIFKIWDLGIAVSSAAKTASMLNVDNRIMYRIGIACGNIKIFNKGLSQKDIINCISPILGLPLSVSGKNIYFDRLDKLQAAQTLIDYHSNKK